MHYHERLKNHLRKLAEAVDQVSEVHNLILDDGELWEARADGSLPKELETAENCATLHNLSLSLAQFFGFATSRVGCVDWYGPAVRGEVLDLPEVARQLGLIDPGAEKVKARGDGL